MDELQRLRSENQILRGENAQLRAENQELRTDLDLVQKKFLEVSDALVEFARRYEEETGQLKARVLDLENELLKSQREAKRQAAPHRRRMRIPRSEHKKPGRSEGHEPAWRRPPPPEEVEETVEVPLEHCCPDCGDELVDFERHVHHVVDLPDMPKLKVTKYVTYSGKCPCCRQRWNSKAANQPSFATGAAGTTIGHNAVALASQMRTKLGVTLRKLAGFFADVFGLNISPAGLLGLLDRATTALEPSYEAIQTALQESDVVCADETGWRVNCESAWAWVFTNYQYTLYTISRCRGHQVPLGILGPEFQGCLLTDCFSGYDPLPYEKAKCIAHLIRALADVEKLQTRGAVRFPRAALKFLRDAMELRKRKSDLSPDAYDEAVAELEVRLDRLLMANITESKNLRLANRLRKHRLHLLTFLHRPDVDPTNNQAERQIRPLVIQRKLSAGNRSERGAMIHSVLTSVMATCCQQGLNFMSIVTDALRHSMALLPLPRPPS